MISTFRTDSGMLLMNFFRLFHLCTHPHTAFFKKNTIFMYLFGIFTYLSIQYFYIIVICNKYLHQYCHRRIWNRGENLVYFYGCCWVLFISSPQKCKLKILFYKHQVLKGFLPLLCYFSF